MYQVKLNSCMLCPSQKVYDGAIPCVESGARKKFGEVFCTEGKKHIKLKVRERRNGIPEKCPKRAKPAKLAYYRHTPKHRRQYYLNPGVEEELENKMESTDYTLDCVLNKTSSAAYFDAEFASSLLREKGREPQEKDIMEVESAFGVMDWRLTSAGWEKIDGFFSGLANNEPEAATFVSE